VSVALLVVAGFAEGVALGGLVATPYAARLVAGARSRWSAFQAGRSVDPLMDGAQQAATELVTSYAVAMRAQLHEFADAAAGDDAVLRALLQDIVDGMRS